MSSPNPRSRSSYNLRPRSKVVVSMPPVSAEKISMSRLEKSRTKKKIAEGVKLSFAETEGAGERYMAMTREELKKYICDKFDARGLVHIPPKHLSVEERKHIRKKQKLVLAETGLSYLNDPANGGDEYELVCSVGGRFFLACRNGPCGIYHFNFEAKLKNDPQAEAQLFFLEIVEKVPGKQKVTHCCSLGLCGSKAAATGLNGCTVCRKINHPKSVRFVTRR